MTKPLHVINWQGKEYRIPFDVNLNLDAYSNRLVKIGLDMTNLKPPVKKAEAKRSPKSAARRKSFCSRMCGMKSKLTDNVTGAHNVNSHIEMLIEVYKKREAAMCSLMWGLKFNDFNE